MEDLGRLLRAHPFLQGLDDAYAQVLVGCAQNLRFEEGAFLVREGDPADTFFLVRHGRAALEMHIPGRETLVVETVGQGDVLGISWTMPSSRVHLDARAIEPVVALALDAACLRRKMEADHDLGYALMKRLLAMAYQRLERVRLQRLDLYRSST